MNQAKIITLVLSGVVIAFASSCASSSGTGIATCAPVETPQYSSTVFVADIHEDPNSEAHPILISIPLPAYPTEFARVGISGEVDVRFSVRPDGSVTGVNVLKSTVREFEKDTKEAVSRWKFRFFYYPGHSAGSDVAVTARIVFDSKIQKAPNKTPQTTTGSSAPDRV
jgi:TonB family protein